jgi:hypothetical protein
MLARLRNRRDPFWDDGVGARERNHRVFVQNIFAFGISVTACGLTLAMWVRSFLPVGGLPGL